MLPAAFNDLAPFLDWAEEGEGERTQRRLRTSLAETTALYDAMLPRLPAIMAHLAEVDPSSMGDADRLLLCLVVAVVEAADSVEYYAPTGSPGPADLVRFTPIHDVLGVALGRAKEA